MPPLLKACLNGSRTRQEHPAIPRTPDELAADGRAAVEAGAKVLHLHPYDATGAETLAAEPCALTLRAVRAACPGIPISLSTSADIEPDPRRRFELIAGWTELPELVTANQGERGILELCELLVARGIGIEAGLLGLEDANAFVGAGIADRCVRVLVEPLDADPDAAVAHAASMEQALSDAGVGLEQIHHGDGVATWHVMERAVARGHGIRVGLEDTTVLRDGRRPAGNAELVGAAAVTLESPRSL
ncbi:MAG: 3-keto-5-aminohexanoate cleavage protein [Gaiellaceae bacterium]